MRGMSRSNGLMSFWFRALALVLAVGLLCPTGCSSSACARCPSSPRPGGKCCLGADGYCTYRTSASTGMGCVCVHGKYSCTQVSCPATQPPAQTSCSPNLKLVTCNYGSAACKCVNQGSQDYRWTCS